MGNQGFSVKALPVSHRGRKEYSCSSFISKQSILLVGTNESLLNRQTRQGIQRDTFPTLNILSGVVGRTRVVGRERISWPP